jgi:NAD(P)-dependent dehydrogenase (short-subunit alcohol dehydrogenase family)
LKDCNRELQALWGEPAFLINGAGGNDPRGSTSQEFVEPESQDHAGLKDFFDLELEGFESVFKLNFLRTFLPTKVFSRGMVQRKSGSTASTYEAGSV